MTEEVHLNGTMLSEGWRIKRSGICISPVFQ